MHAHVFANLRQFSQLSIIFVWFYLLDLLDYICLICFIICVWCQISKSAFSHQFPRFQANYCLDFTWLQKDSFPIRFFCQNLWKAFQIVQLVFNHSWTKKFNKQNWPMSQFHWNQFLQKALPSLSSAFCKLVSQFFYSMAIRGLSKWSHKITFVNELFCELKFGEWGQKFDYFGLEVSNLITCDWILVSAR